MFTNNVLFEEVDMMNFLFLFQSNTYMGKVALIYGSSGALGGAIVSAFAAASWKIIGIDFRPISVPGIGHQILADIVPSSEGDLSSRCGKLVTETGKALDSIKKIDAIVCVAGGWAGGNTSDPSKFNLSLVLTHFLNLCYEEFAHVVDLMYRQSVETSVIASKLASEYLKVSLISIVYHAKYTFM